MSFPVFDLHCDTATMLAFQSLPAELAAAAGMLGQGEASATPELPEPPAAADLLAGGFQLTAEKIGTTPWAQCFACFIPDTFEPACAAALWEHVSGCLDRELAQHGDRFSDVRSAAGIRPALAEGRIAAVRTIENARLFAHDIELVHVCAEQGLLMASLSWNARARSRAAMMIRSAGSPRPVAMPCAAWRRSASSSMSRISTMLALARLPSSRSAPS